MSRKFLLIAFVLSGLALESQVDYGIPQDHLQGFWPFAGNANDISGHQKHGKVFGPVLAKDRFGNENGAYNFNGETDLIYTAYKGVLGRQPRTVSFWALAQNNKKGKTVVSWGSNDNFPKNGGRFDCAFGGCWVCAPGDEYVGATIDVADAGITFEPHEIITDGAWHHYVYQFNGRYVKDVEIYQDGVMLTHEPYRFYKYNRVYTKPEINVTFGALITRTDTISHFKGYLDDVAIYDKMLSREEIKALYEAPDPFKKTNLFKWVPAFFSVIIVILLILLFIRLRVRKLVAKEKEKIDIERKWYEQENRVLKAQMDPHFIFNSLNSIQQFIITNDNDKAQLYLSTFAQLIRMLLESNTSENITLKQELVILEKYLEIESLRFNHSFDHEIIVDKNIDPEKVVIPYFLIQPFVENAIHHGLLPKIGYKELSITFEMPDPETLVCIIEDNGVGRSKLSALRETPFKTKSLGVNFVQQRLLIMSKIENKKYGVEIIDKLDPAGGSMGVRAIVTMPVQKNN